MALEPRWIVGFAILVIGTLWLSLVAAGSGVLSIDLTVSRFVQDHQFPGSGVIADFGNAIGTALVGVPIGLLAAGLFAWSGRRRAAYLMLAATALRTINGVLKSMFDSPRPTNELVTVRESVEGLGFPSGHVMSVTLLCCAALVSLWPVLTTPRRIAATVLAFIVIVATAYARISAGAHWPSDTLGGALWALILIAVPAAIFTRASSEHH
jgi:membrane-associated phospholipid phosphatase